jgi:hypothetical protein
MVTGGSSMLRVWQLYGDNEATPFGLSAWIIVFFGLQLFLSQVSRQWLNPYAQHQLAGMSPLQALQLYPANALLSS